MAGKAVGWRPSSPDPRVASTRIRCLNPLRELRARGYPADLYAPARGGSYGLVVYSKSYDEASYREAEALKARGVRIAFDLCDNHFYNPEASPELCRRAGQLRRMMGLADHLIASTPTMAEVMRRESPSPRAITVIGDAVERHSEASRLRSLAGWRRGRELRRLLAWLESGRRRGRSALVWYGIHGGPHAEHGMSDLLRVRGTLERLHREHPVGLTVISNSRRKYSEIVEPWAIPTTYLEWEPSTFAAALGAHDVAVIPVTLTPFTACKSNNRLTTALDAGVAVVADPVPSYLDFGDVCRLDSWEEGLREYLADPALRERDVRAGRTRVAGGWTLPHIADAWQRLFDRLLGLGLGV